MLKVYGRRNSINVQKVLWLVGELAIEHQHIPVGGSFGGLDTPEYRAINPNAKVPAIDDGGLYVWESHAILRYLAAQYGSGAWSMADAATRARVEPWMDWAQTRLQPDFIGGVFWGFYRTPEAQRDLPAIELSLKRCNESFAWVDARLSEGPYLCGEALSLGDIPVASLLYRYYTLDIERPSLPRLQAYYAGLCDRPAYREHVMVPYDELRGRLAF